MNTADFVTKLKSCVRPGQVLANPGGSVSTVISVDEKNVVYQRGYSRIYLPVEVLYKTYSRFSGKRVSSSELRAYMPSVFDSQQNGHSCHCTFFFMVLKEMGIVQAIGGSGRRGDPFSVEIPAKGHEKK